MTTIYTQDIVSSYILRQAMLGERSVDPKLPHLVIPKLVKDNTLKLMMGYRPTAIGPYSPDIKGYFQSLYLIGEAINWSDDQVIITLEGFKHALEVIRELRMKDQEAPSKLERAFDKLPKPTHKKSTLLNRLNPFRQRVA